MEKVKYVYLSKTNHGKKLIDGDKRFSGQFRHKNVKYHCGNYISIREAQIAVDVKRLSLGLNAMVLKNKLK